MPKQPLALVPDLEAELDELFALPPADFTAARNDLARRLKEAGRSDAAAEVKQLRKPTVPVWAVNQLARRNRDEVNALVEAGEQLRAAHGSGESEPLRAATSAQRSALQTLTQRAHDVLEEQGQSTAASVMERIASTLRAAAVSPDAAELVQAGRLSEELDPAGFDAFAGMPLPRRKPAKKATPAVDRRREERLRTLREKARESEEEAKAAEAEAKKAEDAARRARAKADRARAQLESAEAD